MNNLIAWSLQIGALVAVAALVPPCFRIKMPGVKLAWWQSLLAACLALPFLRPWKEADLRGDVTAAASGAAYAIAPHPSHLHISLTQVVFTLLMTGIAVRLAWLAVGFVKLRKLRLRSAPFECGLEWPFGPDAEVRISAEAAGPVTFGFIRPVILLPAYFPSLEPAARTAILCHERLHVQRRDWLFTVAEELIRAAFWFHPAIWWVLAEIQLAREQAVDLAVIGITRARDQYVDALLATVATGQPDFAAAPMFLRRRHLKQRVSLIVKEVRMSNAKSLTAFAAGLVAIAGLCWFVSGAFPLTAQIPADAPGVSVELNGAQLMHRSPVNYPPDALARGIQGVVVLLARVGPSGTVTETNVIAGPEELRNASVQSVLNWHFAPEAAGTSRQIAISFQLPAQGSRTVKSIVVNGMPEGVAARLRAQLPAREGAILTPELIAETVKTARAFDEHLNVREVPVSPTESNLSISPAAGKLRIGGNVQQANLLTKVNPGYPPDAKAARVQGIVKLEVEISPEGKVDDIRLISGPALLVQSAVDAVRQWVYKPTLLNGSPIGVLTTIDVNYTLSY